MQLASVEDFRLVPRSGARLTSFVLDIIRYSLRKKGVRKYTFLDGVLSDPGSLPGYQDRIEQIMHCNGKDINCLQDLIELKLRLESRDSRQINAILETWKDRYAIKNRSNQF